jgi:uncharacterized protein (TIGR02996 family)
MTPAADEAALWRGIAAAPRDDAPWLVYADWLDEHGREAAAATLRRLLPDAQAAVAAGNPPQVVMSQIARLGVASGWGLPMPAAKPAALPVAPPLGSFERQPTSDPGRQVLWWLAFGAVLFLVRLFAGGGFAPREPDPPVKIDLFRPHWRADELVRHTFELQSDTEVLVVAMDEGGKARITTGKKGEAPTRFDGRWSIVPYGPLRVTRADGTLVCELEKVGDRFDRYEVKRVGRGEVFTLDWTPRIEMQWNRKKDAHAVTTNPGPAAGPTVPGP